MSVQGSRPSPQRRLRRVEGQLRGLAGMVEDDAYCVDVAQLSARRDSESGPDRVSGRRKETR